MVETFDDYQEVGQDEEIHIDWDVNRWHTISRDSDGLCTHQQFADEARTVLLNTYMYHAERK